jgi:AcrR family transcriptional regulator
MSGIDAPASAPVVDGRRLRSERTRKLIIEAYLALLREDPQVPTSARIAERAGYSVRSVFERFPDLLSLRIAATDYGFSLASTQAPIRNVDADRTTRIRSQVQMRAQTCETWLPLWRALNANQGESVELKARIALVRATIVQRLQIMYRPELEALGETERKHTLIALEALTDFESWARMRQDHGLSVEQACNVWVRAIDRLLPTASAVS